MTQDQLTQLIRDGHPQAAIDAATQIIALGTPPAWAYIIRSEAHWATGAMGRALSDLHAAHSIDPSPQLAQRIKALSAIIDYRNTDLLNP